MGRKKLINKLDISSPIWNEKELLVIDCMARKDHEGLTMAQVSETSGVPTRTINYWIANKKGFQSAINQRAKEYIENLAPQVLATVSTALNSRDEKIKMKGLDAFMKFSQQTSISDINSKAMDIVDKKVAALKKIIDITDLDPVFSLEIAIKVILDWNGNWDSYEEPELAKKRLIDELEQMIL